MTPTPQEWGQFGADTVAWAQVLVRLKQAATDNADVILTADEARLIVQYTRMLAAETVKR